MPTADAQV